MSELANPDFEQTLTDPRVLSIPVDTALEIFDTHNTSGEHALKESGAWKSFLAKLEAQGDSLPEHIEDPFDHYLFSGRGVFSRLYVRTNTSSSMLAGMAINRTGAGGMTADALFSAEASQVPVADLPDFEETPETILASGIHRMFTRNVFDRFCGAYGLAGALYLDLPFENLSRALQPRGEDDLSQLNWAFLRGISDFAIPKSDGYRIPLPGQVIELMHHVTTDGVDEVREKMPKTWQGVLQYHDGTEKSILASEYYRNGQLIGKTTLELFDYPDPNIRSIFQADGTELAVPISFGNRLDSSVERAQTLKALAENDDNVRVLILS